MPDTLQQLDQELQDTNGITSWEQGGFENTPEGILFQLQMAIGVTREGLLSSLKNPELAQEVLSSLGESAHQATQEALWNLGKLTTGAALLGSLALTNIACSNQPPRELKPGESSIPFPANPNPDPTLTPSPKN